MKENQWNRRAANLLKAELKLAGLGYDGLLTRLNDLGIEESYKGIANKINRGAFTFAFYLQCMTALKRSGIRLDPETGSNELN